MKQAFFFCVAICNFAYPSATFLLSEEHIQKIEAQREDIKRSIDILATSMIHLHNSAFTQWRNYEKLIQNSTTEVLNSLGLPSLEKTKLYIENQIAFVDSFIETINQFKEGFGDIAESSLILTLKTNKLRLYLKQITPAHTNPTTENQNSSL